MDKKIEKAISKLLGMYEKIENDLLIKIASHFSINDEFLNSDNWRIKKLEEMGLFNQDIINYLARETKHTKSEVKKALNQIGIDTINPDKLNRLFEDEVLKINPNILVNNYTIKNIINSAYNELSNTLIQMSSKIEKGAREAYLNVVEEAYLKTSMGTHSYQEAIRESINDLSNKGIKVLTYKTVDEDGNVTGIRNYDIEGAVRREVLTASRQLNNSIAMEVSNELECEYLYLSEHLQCRPSHFDWQGTVIKRKDLIKITKYGEVDGLAGINCRHYFEPYFGDARNDELKHFNKEECAKAYSLSQHQRYLERGIRKWKRKTEMFKANEDVESCLKCNKKVNEWQSRIKNFTNENDLRRDFNREYTINYNTSEVIIPKSKKDEVLVVKQELPYKDVTQEWIDNAKANSHQVTIDNYFIDDNKIKHPIKNKEMLHITSKDSAEYKRSIWLKETFGGEIHNIPRISDITNTGIKTSTPDFIWNNNKWDLKTPGIDGKFENTLERFVKKKGAKLQAKKFIIDYVNFPNKTDNEILEVINKTLSNKSRNWIEDLVIVMGERIIKIYSKTK